VSTFEKAYYARFPAILVLDTNILDSLPENLQSGELASLVATAGKLRVPVFVPGVVASEWSRHRVESAKESLEKSFEANKHLSQYVEADMAPSATTKELTDRVQQVSSARLSQAGMQVMPTPALDPEELTRRAVEERRPFRKEGRGFKDQLVVLSVLEACAELKCMTAVLVTNDRADFNAGELQERFEPLGTTLVIVRSLQDASAWLGQALDELAKAHEQGRTDRVKGLAEKNWGEIAAAAKKAILANGVPEFVFLNPYVRGDIPLGAHVRRIVAFEPERVSSVAVGPRNRESGKAQITLYVAGSLTLECEWTDFGETSYTRRVRTTEEERPVFPLSTTRRESTVAHTVEAEASAVEDVKGEWSEFRLIGVADW
jgi:hypothetical protein